jgi:phasin
MSQKSSDDFAKIPNISEKTVDQARKAFDGFVAAAQKASEQTEAAAESASAGAREISAKAISYAEANVKAAFDLAESLIKAKDPEEMLAIQSEYLKSQFAAVQEQAKALGEAVRSAALPGDPTIDPPKPTRPTKRR